jgi:hypothetical protein
MLESAMFNMVEPNRRTCKVGVSRNLIAQACRGFVSYARIDSYGLQAK